MIPRTLIPRPGGTRLGTGYGAGSFRPRLARTAHVVACFLATITARHGALRSGRSSEGVTS